VPELDSPRQLLRSPSHSTAAATSATTKNGNLKNCRTSKTEKKLKEINFPTDDQKLILRSLFSAILTNKPINAFFS
jgi:hypothetical protein